MVAIDLMGICLYGEDMRQHEGEDGLADFQMKRAPHTVRMACKD